MPPTYSDQQKRSKRPAWSSFPPSWAQNDQDLRSIAIAEIRWTALMALRSMEK
jgi:hypothetical protein